MRIILVRHGDATSTYGKFHGLIDDSLTEAGKKEAKETAPKLKKYNAIMIITSPMKRARQTAEIIGNELKLKVEANNALRPLDLGDFVGKPTSKENTEKIKKYFENPVMKFPNGESVNKWANNYISFFNKYYFDSNKADKTIIFVTHGRNIVLTKADILLGNNTQWNKNSLIENKISTEHGGYAVATPPKSFEVITPKTVPAGQS